MCSVGAYTGEDEFDRALARYADHIVFNSIHQLKKIRPRLGNRGGSSLGCGSTRSAPPRKGMPSMTPAPRAAVRA